MSNAIWLMLALPEWYFGLPNAGPVSMLTAIPRVGLICLAIGLIHATVKPDRRLALFLIPFAASESLAGLAGVMRGRLLGQSLDLVVYGFLVAQLVGAIYLVYRLRSVRLSAALLAIFSLSYAHFAAFIASMSFADDWT